MNRFLLYQPRAEFSHPTRFSLLTPPLQPNVRLPLDMRNEMHTRAGFKTCLQGFQAGRGRMVVFYNRLSTMTMQAA